MQHAICLNNIPTFFRKFDEMYPGEYKHGQLLFEKVEFNQNVALSLKKPESEALFSCAAKLSFQLHFIEQCF